MVTSPEAVFSYSELCNFLAIHLGKKPAPSTLSAWMDAVLNIPEYKRDSPRTYSMEDAIALACWAIAGKRTKTGERKTRAKRRIELHLELLEQWQQNQQNNSTTVPATPESSDSPSNPVTVACEAK